MSVKEVPEQYERDDEQLELQPLPDLELGAEGIPKVFYLAIPAVIVLLILLIMAPALVGFLLFVGAPLALLWAAKRNPGVLGNEQIVDSWNAMIEGGKGLGDEIIDNTRRKIIQTEAPNIRMSRANISSGFLQGIMGNKRPFFVITYTGNHNLRPYRMYINAMDYGIHLQVSWFLAHQPSMGRKIINLMLCIPVLGLLVMPLTHLSSKPSVLGLDIFDEQDLRAYISTAHRCFIQSVDELGKANNLDTSNMSRKSNGFLGIS